jgi:protoporphyrinogen oxidase
MSSRSPDAGPDGTGCPHDPGQKDVTIIGAGPASLTAAYELTQRGMQPVLFEKLARVGGIARTEQYNGYRFDMGGHRFFTKSAEVNNFWRDLLGEDFLRRPRLSRIYYNKRFFNYPLRPRNAIRNLGLGESILVGLSYLRWNLFPYKEENTFEEWVTNRFGKRLYQTFFETYTEKVWGRPPSELGADWAVQRIKNLSLRSAVTSMFVTPGEKYTTLIEEFDYPRLGPGMLWETVQELVEARGGEVRLGSDVMGICRAGNRISSIKVESDGLVEQIAVDTLISSMPVTQFLLWMDPPPPPEVVEAAKNLSYRDFLTVCLIVDTPRLFPDNWIYIHDPDVKVGRIQNFKNWSPYLVPDSSKVSLGLEYFCDEGDELWSMDDDDLIDLARREIEALGLARSADVIDGVVYRVEKTYPVYDSGYEKQLQTIKQYMATLENVQTIGRNGLHRYNNQDHAMLTGIYAVRNLLDGADYDLWQVNAEQEYHEEIIYEPTPTEISEVISEVLPHVFLKLDPLALGFSFGSVAGVLLMLLTLYTMSLPYIPTTMRLDLLAQIWPGYSVSPEGSILGLFYGFVTGFVTGWLIAFIRNTIFALYLSHVIHSAERSRLRDFLEIW